MVYVTNYPWRNFVPIADGLYLYTYLLCDCYDVVNNGRKKLGNCLLIEIWV
jgi:hypothetical protein